LQVVGRVDIEMDPVPDNIGYLRCKKDKMGHMLELDTAK